MTSSYESDFIYFANENAEPLVLKGEIFNHISIPRGAYTSVINRGPGDNYFGFDAWWFQDGGWCPIEPSTVPERLRAFKLLLDTGGS